MSAMVPSLGAVGADGAAAGPGLLYGDRGVRPGGGRATRPGDSGELLAFLAWHTAQSPGAAGYWPAQAVANHALCGRGVIDTTTAMTAHPLFDFTGWDEALAAEAGATPDQLPALVPGVEPAGEVLAAHPAAGALVGGAPSTPWPSSWWRAPTGPATCWFCAARPSSSGACWTRPRPRSRACGPSAHRRRALPRRRSQQRRRPVPGGGPPLAGPCRVGGRRRGGPDDLPVWLPYVRGERTPLHRRPRASVDSLALHHTAAHLMRAAYEASGFVVRHHLDLARDAGLVPQRIVATGGGTQVPVWMQSLADTTGLPVHVAASPRRGPRLGLHRPLRRRQGGRHDRRRPLGRHCARRRPRPDVGPLGRRALRAVQVRYSKCCVSTMSGRR